MMILVLCALLKKIFHMLIDSVKVQDLWSKVEAWIQSLGMVDYHLTDRKKILGDLENSPQINIILLNVEKKQYINRNWIAKLLLFYKYN